MPEHPPVSYTPPLDWEMFQGVVIVRVSPGSITDKLWTTFMEEVRRSPARTFFSMVLGDVAISSSQRKLSADVMKQNDMSAVTVTDSKLARGMLTAISWLGPKLYAYSWNDFAEALQQIDPSPELRREILSRARGLEAYQGSLRLRTS